MLYGLDPSITEPDSGLEDEVERSIYHHSELKKEGNEIIYSKIRALPDIYSWRVMRALAATL